MAFRPLSAGNKPIWALDCVWASSVINILHLPWLCQKTPEAMELLDDRQRLEKVPLHDIVPLAQMKLDDRDVRRLAKAARGRRMEAADANLVKVRICLACQTTTDLLLD